MIKKLKLSSGQQQMRAQEKGSEHLAGARRQPVGIQWDGRALAALLESQLQTDAETIAGAARL